MHKLLATLITACFATGVLAQAAPATPAAPAQVQKMETKTERKAERKTERKGPPAKKTQRKGEARK
jgi:hypothetical protein